MQKALQKIWTSTDKLQEASDPVNGRTWNLADPGPVVDLIDGLNDIPIGNAGPENSLLHI